MPDLTTPTAPAVTAAAADDADTVSGCCTDIDAFSGPRRAPGNGGPHTAIDYNNLLVEEPGPLGLGVKTIVSNNCGCIAGDKDHIFHHPA